MLNANNFWRLQSSAYLVFTGMRSALDHLMWVADKMKPSTQLEERDDWFFTKYTFSHPDMEFMHTAQRELNGPLILFHTLANRAKHEIPWFGTPCTKEKEGFDIWLAQADGSAVGLSKGVMLPVYRILRRLFLEMLKLVQADTTDNAQTITIADFPKL